MTAKKTAKKKAVNKRKLFVQEYLVDLNATQAAIRAGYSKKTAGSQGQRLLKNVDIQADIRKAFKKRGKRTEITQDRVLLEYARLAFSNMEDFAKWGSRGVELVDSDELSKEMTACVSEVSENTTETKLSINKNIKFKLHDKGRALDALAKHLGMFIERHELTGADGEPLTVQTIIVGDKKIEF